MDPLNLFSNIPHVQELIIKKWDYKDLANACLVCKTWYFWTNQHRPIKIRKQLFYKFLHVGWLNGPEKVVIKLPSNLQSKTRITEYQSDGDDHVLLLSDNEPSIKTPSALVLIRKDKVVYFHTEIYKHVPEGFYQRDCWFRSISLTKCSIVWKVDSKCVLVFKREDASFLLSLPLPDDSSIGSIYVPDICKDDLLITFWNFQGSHMKRVTLEILRNVAGNQSTQSLTTLNPATKITYPYIMTKLKNSNAQKIYHILNGSLLIEFSTNIERNRPWQWVNVNMWECGILTIAKDKVIKGYDMVDNPGLLLFQWKYNYYTHESTKDSFISWSIACRHSSAPLEVHYWNRYLGSKIVKLNSPLFLYIGPLHYFSINTKQLVLTTSTDKITVCNKFVNKYRHLKFSTSGRHGIGCGVSGSDSALELYTV